VTSEALSRLAYLFDRPLGCGVVQGPPRSGKSALLRTLADGCSRRGARTALIDGQGLDGRGLSWELAAGWRIGSLGDSHSRRLAREIRDYMTGALASKYRLAVVLDHADRLEHSAVQALSRLLHEAEMRSGLTLIWSATAPLQGEPADVLLHFTDLRIDCPAPTTSETAELVRDHWRHCEDADAIDFPSGLEQQFAALSRGDLRRAERLAQLSRLAALAEGVPLDREMLESVSRELA
jgi:hypothetical protein